MGLKESIKQALRMCGHAFVGTVHERMDTFEDHLKEIASSQTALLQSSIQLMESPQFRDAVFVDSARENADVALMSFLLPFLPGRGAVDAGAGGGETSERLLRAGYEVYALEPLEENYARLCERLGGLPNFRGLHLALGSEQPTLADLHRQGAIPASVGLVNVSARGHELDVLRGMGEHRYAAVVLDDRDAAPETTEGAMAEMRARRYAWSIVLYTASGQDGVSFFCNQNAPVAAAWRKTFFFHDRDLFTHAEQWCAAALPRTFFRSCGAR